MPRLRFSSGYHWSTWVSPPAGYIAGIRDFHQCGVEMSLVLDPPVPTPTLGFAPLACALAALFEGVRTRRLEMELGLTSRLTASKCPQLLANFLVSFL